MVDPATKTKAVKMLDHGRASLTEVARLAGVSRQLLNYWAKQAHIDINASRLRYLNYIWKRM